MLYKPNTVSPNLTVVDASAILFEAEVSGRECVAAQLYVYDEDSDEWDKWKPVGDKISLTGKYNGEYIRIAVVQEGESYSVGESVDAIITGNYFENGSSYKWRMDLWEREAAVSDGKSVFTRCGTISGWWESDSNSDIKWDSGQKTLSFYMRKHKSSDSDKDDDVWYRYDARADNLNAYIEGNIFVGAYLGLKGTKTTTNDGETTVTTCDGYGKISSIKCGGKDLTIAKASSWAKGDNHTIVVTVGDIYEVGAASDTDSDTAWECDYFDKHIHEDWRLRNVRVYSGGYKKPPIYIAYGAATGKTEKSEVFLVLQYSNLIKDGMYINFPDEDDSDSYYSFEIEDADVQEATITVSVDGRTLATDASYTYKIYSDFLVGDEYYFSCEEAQTMGIYIDGQEPTEISAISNPRCTVSGVLSGTGSGTTNVFPTQSRLQVLDNLGNLIYDSGKVFQSIISFDLNMLLGGYFYTLRLWAEDNFGRVYETETLIHVENWDTDSADPITTEIDTAQGTVMVHRPTVVETFEVGTVEYYYFSVYKKRADDKYLIYLGDLPSEGIGILTDYSVGNYEKTVYYIFQVRGDEDSNGNVNQATSLWAMSETICPEWYGYFIVGLIPADDSKSRLKATTIWNFCIGAEEGTVSHNYGSDIYKPLSQYPKIGRDENDYLSGSLTVSLGMLECEDGEYYRDSAQTQELWRQFCVNTDEALYKDLKGNVYKIAISTPTRSHGNHVFRNMDGSPLLPTTISFNWTEVGSIRDIPIAGLTRLRKLSEFDNMTVEDLDNLNKMFNVDYITE